MPNPNPDWLVELQEIADRLAAEYLPPPSGLRCVECGTNDDGRRGWTLRLDVDDELVAFCPDCDRGEFGCA
jgi:hypothetical protein